MQRTYQLSLSGPISVPEATRDRLFALGKRRSYADGQFIMHQNETADGFFAIASGQVVIGGHGADGTLTIYGIGGPGDMFGEPAFLTATPRTYHAVADGEADVIFFDGTVFKRSIAGDPELLLVIIGSLVGQMRVLLERSVTERNLTVAGRLAKVLLQLGRTSGETVNFTQQELGDLVGVSRVTLGTALRKLEASGAVVARYGKVSIADPERLAAAINARGAKPVQGA